MSPPTDEWLWFPTAVKSATFVCIINGAKMPFLLRRKESISPEVFKLVGTCYVNGIMHGDVNVKDEEFTIV